MVNNFTKLSKEDIEQDDKQVASFFNRAKRITRNSSDDIYILIQNISEYCQIHYTQYREQLNMLQIFLSECIQSICNNDETGFIRLNIYLETKDYFVKKGWLAGKSTC
ncbi:MAG: hypothetical protein IKN65_07385 [Clostridia bacterium]|nr:hypothetical protein [Clostridia bacterium]